MLLAKIANCNRDAIPDYRYALSRTSQRLETHPSSLFFNIISNE